MFTAYLVDDEELIKAVKDSNTACEFVMISAFDYFDSVRAFFQQSGFDYILKPVRQDDIQMVLERLVLRLKEKNPEPKTVAKASEHSHLNEMLAFIDDNFSSKITLEMLSKQFGFSRNYICNLFSKYYDTSLTCYLTGKRMAHAKKLLEDKSRLLKDIAIECGYSDYVCFYKVFKEYYGMAPKEMLEQH